MQFTKLFIYVATPRWRSGTVGRLSDLW